MSPMHKRAVVMPVLVATAIVIVVLALTSSDAVARPQDGYGISCMYTRHLMDGQTNSDLAYTDPGDGYVAGEWTVEFQHRYTGTDNYTSWMRVDQYGDVDELSYCTYLSTDVCIWAFGSNAVPLDTFDETRWRIFIKEDYPGNECDDDSSEPVVAELDSSGTGVLSATACVSRAIGPPTDEYEETVYHD